MVNSLSRLLLSLVSIRKAIFSETEIGPLIMLCPLFQTVVMQHVARKAAAKNPCRIVTCCVYLCAQV